MASVNQTEAAERLGVHRNTIRNMLDDGRLEVAWRTRNGLRYNVKGVRLVSLLEAEDEMYGPVRCSRCGHLTTRLEAYQRRFHFERCGECGGELARA